MGRSSLVSKRGAAGVSAALATIAISWAIAVPVAAQEEQKSSVSQRATPPRPLDTAFLDPASLAGPDGDTGFRRVRQAGATFVRVMLNWNEVAPVGEVKPADFVARDPADPLYRWAELDRQVRAAAVRGLAPLVYVQAAPLWAQSGQKLRPNDGPVRPNPAALGDFATAAASRYSGSFGGLPRVRHWQVWNEPNLNIQLMPQFTGDTPVSADLYRSMVNAMAGAVHAVHRDNVVVAGGLAPFGGDSNDPSGGNVPNQERVRPMEFMRRLLAKRVEFDVWSHHPYTYGGPTHKAFHKNDVSLGDLDKMTSLLKTAERRGQIKSRGKVEFWVTEFSYDSQPADPKGLPPALHARWVSEALYRMWSDGVSLVTWFLIRDEPFPQGMFQSGFYTKDDRPKLALRAFRFPFVAFWAKNGSISYWGRTPAGVKKSVVIEQKAGKWRRVAVPTVDRYGIFSGRIENVRGSGSLRARLASGGDFSQPFSLTVPKDFRFCPWGSFC